MSKLPPGPRIGLFQVLRYLREPYASFERLAEEYGDPFWLPVNGGILVTSEPAAIQQIYGADPDLFAPILVDMGLFLSKRSLIVMTGAEHRAARKLLSPPFHGARMRAYGAAMRDVTLEHMGHLPSGQPFALADVTQKMSMDVILRVIFGVEQPERMREFAAALISAVESFAPSLMLIPALRHDFGGIGPYARFQRRLVRLHTLMDEQIALCRKSPREDILSLLVQARYDDGSPMSDEEIRSQLMVLVMAGHETTAITVAWAMYYLHLPENAAALARVLGELDGLSGSGELDPEAIVKLPYLEAVINETMRLCPLIPLTARRLVKPFTIKGYEVPAGSAVAPSIVLLHMRPDLYPEPHKWRPERFLPSEGGRRFGPFEFIPFGGGARRCLGAAMATYETKILLGVLLSRGRFRRAETAPETFAARGATVGPKRGVRMVYEGARGR